MLDVKTIKLEEVVINKRAVDRFAGRPMQKVKNASERVKIEAKNTIIIDAVQ